MSNHNTVMTAFIKSWNRFVKFFASGNFARGRAYSDYQRKSLSKKRTRNSAIGTWWFMASKQ